jgi:type IV pilus assembly protein PilC
MTPTENPSSSKDNLRDSMRNKLRGGSPSPEQPTPHIPSPTSSSGGGDGGGSLLKSEIYFGNPGLAQIAAFCRQLATLVDVGIPLVQCLKTLSKRVEHPKLKKVVGEVARDVEEGNSFSKSLAKHPEIFSSLVVNVARIGETGGILESALKYLAEIMERRYEIRQRVRAALAYPVAALIVCGIVIMIILGFAMPVFQEVYKSNEVELPGLTKFVLGLSDFVQGWWWLIILAVAGGWFFIRQSIRSSEGVRRTWDALCLKLPIVSGLAVKVNVTRTARTMANLLQAGIPLLEALTITRETSENSVVADMLKAVHDHIEKGGQMDRPFRDAGVFPDLVVDMIAIGDEANRLDLMFEKIGESYDSDVNNSIRTLNAILEPLLIIVMGTIVLTLALAVLLPYWKLGKAIAD